MSAFQFGNNTFSRTVKDHERDHLAVEVGDAKQNDFLPQYKAMRWSNEVNFSIRGEVHPNARIKTAGGIIKYATPDWELHQYEKPEVSADGGFEFEWVLLKRPVSNVLRTTIQSKGLDLFYQPHEITDGEPGFRPENVKGSYAVYHKSKGGLVDADGHEYRSGKAFHIYRPEAVSANGKRVWCDLNITGDDLTVTVPQEFLDTASYPITVDPTFGYTTVGGSALTYVPTSSPAVAGLANQMTAASGDKFNSVSVYTSGTPAYSVVYLNPYTMSGGLPDARFNGAGLYAVDIETSGWQSSTSWTHAMSAGSTYCIAFGAQDADSAYNFDVYYDSGSTPGRVNASSYTLDNPWSDAGTGDSGRHYTWYGTYTSAGGGGGANTTNFFQFFRKYFIPKAPRRWQLRPSGILSSI